MLVDVALHEDSRDVGVEPHGKQHRCQFDRLFPDDVRLVENRQGVQVDDPVEHVAVVLPGNPVDECPEMVPEVNGPGGLDAGENAGHAKTLLAGGPSDPDKSRRWWPLN